MKKLLFTSALFLILLFPFPIQSQHLEDDVIVSAALTPVKGEDDGLMMWTMGEIMVEYFDPGTGPKLDQGYLQYWCLVTSVDDLDQVKNLGWKLSLWPNPLIENQLHLQSDATLDIAIFDVVGRRLKVTRCSNETIILDLSNWPAATYWLQALDEKGRSRAFQIQKF